MISFACPACGKPLKVKDEVAGKRVKCPGCGKALVVPANGRTAFGPSKAAPDQPADDERTLPPGPAVASDGPTIPPAVPRPARELSSPTVGAGDNDADENTGAHYDFLAPAERPDEIGRLGGFRILKVLGAGGMGVVFQAEDPKLERKLAIKAMLPSLAASESARKRFLREAQTAAAIEHDHIVPIHQVGEDRGVPFIAMPFLKGEPLDERLKRDSVLPVAEVVRIGREAARGLAAAHAVGLVHRDIKPANLWLETLPGEPEGLAPGYRVKILDFGLARAAADNSQLTQQGAIIGTPAFMAPEQGAGETVDQRCDLFSLGCVLYRLCTGQMPFKGKDTVSTLVSVATDTPQAPAEIQPEVPAELSDLVMELLAKKPEDRPESARVVAERLAALATTSTTDATKPGLATGSPQRGKTRGRSSTAWRRGRRLAVGAMVLLALVLVGVGLFFGLRSRTGRVLVNLTEPDVEIQIDGAGKWALADSKMARLELPPGEHKLTVKRGAEELYSAPFTVKRGAEVVLDAKWAPRKYTNSLGMEFVLVPRGKAWLGGGGGKPGDKEVEIKEDFYLGKYEVTQEEWGKLMGTMPSHFSRAGAGKDAVKDIPEAELKRFPVEQVSWDDAQLFLRELNKRDKHEGWVYRLPKEVEWEYACRGGPMADKLDSAFDFYFDKPVAQLQADQANFKHDKGLTRTCKVGSYEPNKLGLYDMHGNAREWCEDEQKLDNGASPRVARGGSWGDGAADCRAANRRNAHGPANRINRLGLRLARVPIGKDVVAPPPPPEKKAEAPPRAFKNSIGMEFVLVPRGKSWLGGGGGKPGDKEVEIKEDFYLGKYEVTQEEWAKVMGANPSRFLRTGAGKDAVKDVADEDLKRFPVEQVSWDDAQLFVAALNARAKEAGWVYRLPKEAEWEYACRGGLSTKYATSFDYYFQQPTNQLLPEQANFEHGKGLKRTCKVGSYKPNRLGLYDMHGNVWEWCDDLYDPKDPMRASRRVSRGGGWRNTAGFCRAAFRDAVEPALRDSHLGLRLARVPVGSVGK